jgi:polygalacturonase
MIFQVSTKADMASALAVATGGDVISLKGGDYTDVKLSGFKFDTPVIITSADPNDPAVFTNVTLNQVDGLTFKDVEVEVVSGTGLIIANSKNVVVDDVEFYGASQDKLGGTGILVRNSSDVTISKSEFHHLGNGMSHLDSNKLNVTDSSFHDIRIDGIHGGGTSNVLIARNTFTDFYRQPGEHTDAIQFWTANTKASAENITITGNLISRGDGNGMQGIFVGDESRGKLPFINLTITDNTVIGSMYNGIAVSQAKNLLIDGNTVVGYQDMKAWILVKGANGATISDNTTSQLSLDSSNLNLTKLANQIVPLIDPTDAVALSKWLVSTVVPDQTPAPEPGYGFDPMAFGGVLQASDGSVISIGLGWNGFGSGGGWLV